MELSCRPCGAWRLETGSLSRASRPGLMPAAPAGLLGDPAMMDLRDSPLRRPRPDPRRRPGRRQRRGADARVRQPRGGREDALTGQAHFWSRSRQALWRKGETSGNTLQVVEVTADCDGDALLVRARPAGPTCHRGTRSCFEPNAGPAGARLAGGGARIPARRRPETSYTARLLARGIERIAQKVGEEGVETAIAAVSLAVRGAEEAGAPASPGRRGGGPPLSPAGPAAGERRRSGGNQRRVDPATRFCFLGTLLMRSSNHCCLFFLFWRSSHV